MSLRSVSTRRLATLAAAGIGLFVLNVALLPLAEPGYDLNRQAISELALGPWGVLQDVAFCILGAASLSLAIVLRRTTRATVGPMLLTLAGVLDVVSAFVHAVRYDAPMTTAAVVHMVAGIATFIAIIVAMFAMVRPFRRSESWRSFARTTLIWACTAAAAFFLLGPGLLGQAHFGLQQRGMAVSFLSWMLTTALVARRVATTEQETGAARPAADPGLGVPDGALR